MSKRLIRTWPAALLGSVVLVVGSAETAHACLVKNGASQVVTVWFDCGVACGNYFDLKPGESASRPSKAGYVFMGTELPDPALLIDHWFCEQHFQAERNDAAAHVDAHGEAVAYFTQDDIARASGTSMSATWVLYDKHDKRSTFDTNLAVNVTTCSWGTP